MHVEEGHNLNVYEKSNKKLENSLAFISKSKHLYNSFSKYIYKYYAQNVHKIMQILSLADKAQIPDLTS